MPNERPLYHIRTLSNWIWVAAVLVTALTFLGTSEGVADSAVLITGAITFGLLATLALRASRRLAEGKLAGGIPTSSAAHLNRLKDEFLVTLSHDLRTPLNAILGWAQLISRQGLDGDKLREGLSVIERNARVQAKMIDDLLDINKIICGKIKLEIDAVELERIASEAVSSVQQVSATKGVQLNANIPPDLGIIIVDKRRILQMLNSLLSNAIKFTPRGGSVDLSVSRSAEEVTIVVKDTGTGIEEEFLEVVFEHFDEVDSTFAQRHGGLGLGLNVVKQLVELHGGRIIASSDGLDQGSVFKVIFPVTAKAEVLGPRDSRIESPGAVANGIIQ